MDGFWRRTLPKEKRPPGKNCEISFVLRNIRSRSQFWRKIQRTSQYLPRVKGSYRFESRDFFLRYVGEHWAAM